MKLDSMKKIPDEDAGLMFHSVIYRAYSSEQFKFWAEQHCRGKWGCEEKSFIRHILGEESLFCGWLYDDQDAMLFKLSFA